MQSEPTQVISSAMAGIYWGNGTGEEQAVLCSMGGQISGRGCAAARKDRMRRSGKSRCECRRGGAMQGKHVVLGGAACTQRGR